MAITAGANDTASAHVSGSCETQSHFSTQGGQLVSWVDQQLVKNISEWFVCPGIVHENRWGIVDAVKI